MQARFKQRIASLTSELWFIPAVLTAVSIGLAAVLLRVDHVFEIAQWAEENPILFTSARGAQSLLATVAGSTISVAGVLFSITILVLSTAARQFGPGLLETFMHHRGTQVVLGTFVGTFTYSLVVLRFVDAEVDFIPHVAVNVGMLLGLVSFFLLVYFIHHVATFIQVARVVEDVAGRMERTLRQAFPERQEDGEDEEPDNEEHSRLADRVRRDGHEILALRPGYLQTIENDQLVAIACGHDLVISLAFRPGHFVLPGAVLATVVPEGRVDAALERNIRNQLLLGAERSEAQDPEHAVHQLVEIAVRALSPAINDPYTALNCVDRLGAALALLAQRQLPSRFLRDRDNHVRLIANPLTYAGIVEAAFNQIRQLSTGHLAVILRVLEIMSELARRELPAAFRDALIAQLDAMDSTLRGKFDNSLDHREYEQRRTMLAQALRIR